MHSENHENLANTVGECDTVSVQENFDDFHSASCDSLSPNLGEVWRSVLVHDKIFEEERSATSSTFPSDSTTFKISCIETLIARNPPSTQLELNGVLLPTIRKLRGD